MRGTRDVVILSQVRREEKRAASARVVITTSLFLVLLATALLFGGHAIIASFLQASPTEREARQTGEVVFAMPDGSFCRHLSFDNATAEIAESTVTPCSGNIGGGHAVAPHSFAWGGH